jgi:hypothetical protein
MIEADFRPSAGTQPENIAVEQRTPVSFIGVAARIRERELLFLPPEPGLP